MKPIKILPKNEAHWLQLKTKDITSTEVSGLFQKSKHHTYYSLYNQKKGNIEINFPDVERVFWGQEMEATIARGVEKRLHLIVKKNDYYIRHGEVSRMASSFDFMVTGVTEKTPDDIKEFFDKNGPFNLEIKNVDGLIYRDQWLDDLAPPHIELQVQQQMEVADINGTMIAALVGGNELKYILRDRDFFQGQEIISKINEFWYNFDQNIDPDPNFEEDAENVLKLYQSVNPDLPVFDATKANNVSYRMSYLIRQTHRLNRLTLKLQDRSYAHKAEIMSIMGEFPKAKTSEFTISTNYIKPVSCTVEKEGYRTMRITKNLTKK